MQYFSLAIFLRDAQRRTVRFILQFAKILSHILFVVFDISCILVAPAKEALRATESTLLWYLLSAKSTCNVISEFLGDSRAVLSQKYIAIAEGRAISLTGAKFVAAEECNYYFRLLQPWPVSASLAEERKLSRACASIGFRSRLQMAVQLLVFDKIAVIHYIAPYLLWLDCTSFILILQSTYHIFVISRTTMDDLPVLCTSNNQKSIGT